MLLAGSNYQTRSAQNAFLSWVGDVFLKHGFAVYAYDKRGADFSAGERSDGFVVADAVKGFEAMARQPEVRASCMGIWGISQGGMAAPKVAAMTPGVAFIANTSGAVVSGNLQEIQRTALEMRADGFPESEIADAVRLQTLKFNYAMTGKGWDEYIAAYHALTSVAHGFPIPTSAPRVILKAPPSPSGLRRATRLRPTTGNSFTARRYTSTASTKRMKIERRTSRHSWTR